MSRLSWIALYPEWYTEECRHLARHFPGFRADAARLADGELRFYGELVVRPPGGTQRYPVALEYPAATPYEKPLVVPLETLPQIDERGTVMGQLKPRMFDHRHQMPDGALCLFQRETRAHPLGDVVSGVDTLRRAADWFLGHHTDHWPPDSAESELEAHFRRASDILFGDSLYSGQLAEGFGHFYFVRDYRRRIDAPDETSCPMIVTSMTIESGPVTQVIDMRRELARAYPWIRNDAWGAKSVIESEAHGPHAHDTIERGYWWSLPAEPRPYNTGEGLLRELGPAVPGGDAWRAVSEALGPRMATDAWHCIALRYPGRHRSVEWLVVVVAPGDQRAQGGVLLADDAEKRRRFAAAPVVGIRVHSIRREDLHLRNTGVVESGIVGKTVALIGLGALGSAAADLLAKAGVGTFRLCDLDYLATGNVTRHVGGIADFGAAKARVVASRLLEINPHVRLVGEDLEPWSATGDPERLAAMIAAADLIVATTADEGVETFVNHLAVLQGKPVVYGRALLRASVGRVFLVRPGQDACKACLAAYAEDGRTSKPTPAEWIDVRESPDEPILHECGRPVIPGSAVDLAFIAALAARVALTTLEGRAGGDNHWLWAREAVPAVAALLDRPLSTAAVRLEPRSDCAICAEPEIAQVVLNEGVSGQIETIVEASIDAETGGILIGHVDEQRRAVIVRATKPGPGAERSATRFRRDVAYVQAELDRASTELGDHGGYLGEWHSHLVADPRPSPTDIASLLGIAHAPNYLTRSPMMIIAGLDTATGRCASLRAWAFPLGRAMHPLAIAPDGEARSDGNGDQ